MQGGSHGGFLTTHLAGQFPELFAGAACRNPVVNLAAEVSSTDIPDWVYCEAGLDSLSDPWAPGRLQTKEDYRRFFEASPIAHIGTLVCPLSSPNDLRQASQRSRG